MQWIEAVVHTTTAGSDLVSDLLVRNGALGTQVMDRKDVDEIKRGESAWELFDEKLISEMPRDVLVKGWFSQEDQKNLDTLDEQLGTLREQSPGIDMGLLKTDVSAVADDDWAESWKRYYKPFRVGKRLIVKPSWEPFKPAGKDLIIEIDPGMAFGTGTHETTNMCMMLLETYLGKDMRVMDVGTGSGILAIAAAKLGAAKVLGIDVDADAVKVAQENIRRNGVENIVTAVKGDMVRGEAIDLRSGCGQPCYGCDRDPGRTGQAVFACWRVFRSFRYYQGTRKGRSGCDNTGWIRHSGTLGTRRLGRAVRQENGINAPVLYRLGCAASGGRCRCALPRRRAAIWSNPCA